MSELTSENRMRPTRLYVELSYEDYQESGAAAASLAGADGFVAPPDSGEPPQPDNPQIWILRDADPALLPAWRERDGTNWVAGKGVEATLRLRDSWPDLEWVPRAEVYRPEVRFDFQPASPGEGFSMYMPDTAAVQGFRIADVHREGMEAWLSNIAAEGFRTVWLHSRDAAARGGGADIEMLHRAREHFAGGRIWVSGGVTAPRHLKTLATEGGAKAVVIPGEVVRKASCIDFVTALELERVDMDFRGDEKPVDVCDRRTGAA